MVYFSAKVKKLNWPAKGRNIPKYLGHESIKSSAPKGHGNQTSRPFLEIMTDRPTNRPTDQSTVRQAHREVSLPIKKSIFATNFVCFLTLG